MLAEDAKVAEYYADRVYQAVIDAGGCFVASTLVHTDKGLVPIQDIKVGDRVLSKPENDPDSKLIYQPVTQIHKFTNKHIHLLHIAEKFDNQIEPIVNQIMTHFGK